MWAKIGYAALACAIMVALSLLAGATPEWAGRFGGAAALGVIFWPRKKPTDPASQP